MTKENQNNLILLEDLGMMLPTEVSKQQKRFGIYKCQCGKEFKAQVASVKIYAIKNDRLELLKEIIKEEFNL